MAPKNICKICALPERRHDGTEMHRFVESHIPDPATVQNKTPDWEPAVVWVPLATRILAVATTRIEGSWSAYIGVVAGVNHDREYMGVLDRGTKLAPKAALALFENYPEFADKPYAL